MFGRTEQLTRHELYDLVWSTPMMTLADKFKLSGNGLAKLCARHNIPVPERGYWQRKEAGQAPKQPALSPAKHELLERVEIYVKGDPKEWLTIDEIADFDSRIDGEKSEERRVVVEENVSRHPLIVSTRHLLDRSVGSSDRPHLDVRVTRGSRSRALKIMSAVVKACIARGYPLVGESGTKASSTAKVKIRSELIGFRIEEPTRRIDHVLTKREERDKAAGRGWAIEKYDFVPTGKLRLVINEGMQDEQTVFADTVTLRLEDRLQEFMVGLLRVAMVLRARANYWKECERAREEAAQRQRDEEARLAAERYRRRELLRDSANYTRAETLNRLIAAVEGAGAAHQLDATVEEWLKYARSVADSLNPVPRIVRSLLLEPWCYETITTTT